ncbi:hypothetical protein LRP49_08025 [Enterovibrio sp. ZSDZ35]|uniref:TNase-like domain-containing protein n=1 Tax=Enterovibrio qingdaonensis TaxID=2899818 RepID=A0ABT5QJI6_9GAMM|nr:hypothetical protein [Enterovibrio sp. ZSDZ35]MDD1781151.1 hypothetical protein [Enterovibrio sp. ZSDZ35]
MKTLRKRWTKSLFLFWTVSSFSLAEPTIHQFPTKLIKVISGDTVRVLLEVYPHQYTVVDLRLYGIEAPQNQQGEKHGAPISECEIALGKAAKQHVAKLLRRADSLRVNNIDPKMLNHAGEMVGDLWFTNDGIEMSVAEYLLEQNLVAPYFGEKRSIWDCETPDTPKKSDAIATST